MEPWVFMFSLSPLLYQYYQRTSKSFPVSSSPVYWCSVCDWGILQSSAREQNWTLGLARGWEVITTDWFWHIVRPAPAVLLSSCPLASMLSPACWLSLFSDDWEVTWSHSQELGGRWIVESWLLTADQRIIQSKYVFLKFYKIQNFTQYFISN